MKTKNWSNFCLNMKCVEYTVIFLCIVLLLLFLHPVSLRAQSDDTGSIELQCILPGAKFALYQVGMIEEDQGSVILIDTLSKYQDKIDFESYTAATILSQYVEMEHMKPIATEITDENGGLKYSNLKKGVYLIYGSQTMYKGEPYISSPVLIQLPMIQNGTLTMNPVVIHKNDCPKRLTNPSSKDKKSTNSTEDSMPQTGQLWWPVFVLSCMGLFLLITGYLYNKKF